MITRNELKQSPVRFEQEGHKYIMPDGSLVKISLTRLLAKYGIAPDFSGIDPEVLQKAADRGTEIHAQLESYDNDGTAPTHEWAIPYTSLQLPVIASEFLINYKDVVATKIDKVIATENGVIIADIKTTSKVELESVTWQCNIASYMFRKQTKLPVESLQCIHLRDGKVKVIDLVKINDRKIAELLRAEKNETPYFVEPVTSKLSPKKFFNKAVQVLKLEKKYKESMAKLKDEVCQYMQEKGIKDMTTPEGDLSIVLIPEHTTQRFDSKTALADNPELAKYYKESTTKASIRITAK